MCGNIDDFIYCFVDSFCIEKRYVMVTYYVTLFVSLLVNYLLPHHFCLYGIYVTTYVTSLNQKLCMQSLISENDVE
jgi:hypothetical protein